MTSPPPLRRIKSKTLATWLGVVGGGLGLHRFYLGGLKDVWGWLHVPATLIGLAGVQRMLAFGVDDAPAAWMLPLGGLSIAAGMLGAIVCGLTSDEKWNARFNPQAAEGAGAPSSGWGAVLGVIAGLLVGATVLLSAITFTLQRYYEADADRGHQISQ